MEEHGGKVSRGIQKMLKTFWYLRNIKKSKKELEKIQWRLLKKTLDYAYNNTEFYKNKFDRANISPDDIKNPEDMLRIPVTTKEEIQKCYDEMIAKGYDKNKLVKMTTSGSTGKPTILYFDKISHFYLMKVFKYRSKVFNGLKFSDRIVNIREELTEDNERANRRLFNRITGLTYLTTRESIEVVSKKLLKIKPTVIYSRPSDLMEIVKYIKKECIKPFKLKMILSSSELLTENERHVIEYFFRCKIYDIYGNAELKEIAWQCHENQGYHINVDAVFVEFVKDGRHAKEHEDADLVVTSLCTRSMPLIRYANEDRGVYTNRLCACGCEFSLIEKITGRKADYFHLKNGESVAPHVTIKIIRYPLEGKISQFHAIQKSKNNFTIKLVPTEKYEKKSEEKMVAGLRKLLGGNVSIKIELVRNIPKERSGKYRIVKGEVRNFN